jgi:hypothetical protein
MKTPRITVRAFLLLLAATLAGGGAGGGVGWGVGLAAQAADRPLGRGIAGAIVDATTGAPVRGATVVLQPESAGAFPGPATGSAFTSATRAVASDADGGYRFDGLPSGVYRVYVTSLGYRPFSLIVELRGDVPTALSIGLDADPIALMPVRGRAQPRGPYHAADAFGPDVDIARRMAADLRRRSFLTTDVRELTHADVVESVTLGEPDVFRALQRLPGVTTRSDYTAELWTRGAAWSHTRVYYDGVPVFNPLHALGMVSGIGSSAVGAVWFHPGVRSASMAEGAAGVVDLQSRRALGNGEVNAQADVSLMTAGFALDQRVLDGQAGWMVSGRRTYMDWLADLARRAASQEDVAFPYGFAEVAGRVDAWLGRGTLLEASWLWENDRFTGTPRQDSVGLTGTPIQATWGNSVARATLTAPVGGWSLRNTVAVSLHHGLVVLDPGQPIPTNQLTRRLSESRVGYLGLTGTLTPELASLAGPAWAAGYALEHHGVGYYGPHALPVPRSYWSTLRSGSRPDSGDLRTTFGRTAWNTTLPLAALWAETSQAMGEQVSVRAGLRLEASEPLLNAGALRVAPRLVARYSPLPEVAISAGLGRTYQYTQALAPGGIHLASLISSDVWLLAGPRVPAIRSDMATLGFETWLAPARLFTFNLFGRQAAGVATPDPRPGPLKDRIDFVIAENAAYGLEAGVRQLAGPVTGSVSYSLSRSRMTALGLEYPAASDRTHVFDATALVRARPSLRLGAAFTAATGVPFTRTLSDAAECEREPGCRPADLPWAGTPHALRAPRYASLDLLADWGTRVAGTEIGFYAQLRNALGRENGTVYTGDACLSIGCGSGDIENRFEQGVPRLPVLGVRVRR